MSQSSLGRLPPAPKPFAIGQPQKPLDIHELFSIFNSLYFRNTLQGVFVEYSSKMTLCAGTCTYLGAGGGCRIALSEPILTRRPAADTHDTLLHEMIHASLFLKHGVRVRDGPDGHGPLFLAESERINGEAGSNITVYHNFHDEVDVSRVHWWTCNGPCGRIVKRAMNRAPAATDIWWPQHLKTCGGTFEKTHEPAPKAKAPKFGAVAVPLDGHHANENSEIAKSAVRVRRIDHMMRASIPGKIAACCNLSKGKDLSNSMQRLPQMDAPARPFQGTVSCPVCSTPVANEVALNVHLDICLADDFATASQPDFVPEPHRTSSEGPEVAAQNSGVDPIGSTSDRMEESTKIGTRISRDSFRATPKVSLERPFAVELFREAYEVGTSTRGGVYAAPLCGVSLKNETQHSDLSAGTKQPCQVGGDQIVDVVEADGLSRRSRRMLNTNATEIIDGCKYATSSGIRDRLQDADSVSRWRGLLGSTEMIDFAIGVGCGFAPIDEREFPDNAPGPSRDADHSLPEVPKVGAGPSNGELIEELSKRLKLWQPGADIGEPLFAAGAARQGVTSKGFLGMVLKDCVQVGTSLELSEEAKALFTCSSHSYGQRRRTKDFDSAWNSNQERMLSDCNPPQFSSVRRAKPDEHNNGPCSNDAPALASHDWRSECCEQQLKRSRLGADVDSIGRQLLQTSDQECMPGVQAVSERKTSSDLAQSASKSKPQGDVAGKATCPMCGTETERSLMHQHLEQCLQDSECASQEGIDVYVPRNVHARVADETNGLPAELNRDKVDSANCPICDELVPRSELEAHTVTCMANSGLMDAFG